MRWWGAAGALLLAVGSGCAQAGNDVAVEGEDEAPGGTTTTTTTVAAAPPRLVPALVRAEDLGDPAVEATVVAQRFSAEAETRFGFCGEDLRVEWGTVAGRQSRLEDGEVEISHTVTAGGDPAGLVARFGELVASCPGPWTDPPLETGGGPIEREITGSYPVPPTPSPAAGAIIRSTNERGATDTVVVVMAAGEVLSSVSVSGVVGSEFALAEVAVAVAARRLTNLTA